jgi:hypothetical protein
VRGAIVDVRDTVLDVPGGCAGPAEPRKRAAEPSAGAGPVEPRAPTVGVRGAIVDVRDTVLDVPAGCAGPAEPRVTMVDVSGAVLRAPVFRERRLASMPRRGGLLIHYPAPRTR